MSATREHKVTPREGLFVAEYLIDLNATRAATAAGYAAGSAHVTGARLLRTPAVAAAIEDARARRMQKLEFKAEFVIQELMKLATFDSGMLYDAEGQRIPVHRLDPDVRAWISQVEDETSVDSSGRKTRTQRIKMSDKLKAVELLGRHGQLFGDTTISASASGGDAEITVTLVRPG